MADDATPQDQTSPEPTSRRNLLRMVGIGAAGVAAAGVAGVVAAGPASAADPNDLDLTVASNPHATRTGTCAAAGAARRQRSTRARRVTAPA